MQLIVCIHWYHLAPAQQLILPVVISKAVEIRVVIGTQCIYNHYKNTAFKYFVSCTEEITIPRTQCNVFTAKYVVAITMGECYSTIGWCWHTTTTIDLTHPTQTFVKSYLKGLYFFSSTLLSTNIFNLTGHTLCSLQFVQSVASFVVLPFF